MSEHGAELDAERVLALFQELPELLAANGAHAQHFVVGGAAMALAYDQGRLTRDVDALFIPAPEVRQAAEAIAAEHELEPDWLNDAAKGFLPGQDERPTTVFESEALLVQVASPEYLLAADLHRGDGAVLDPDRDGAGVDAESLDSFLTSDDEAATAAEVVDVESALPHVAPSVRCRAREEGCNPRQKPGLMLSSTALYVLNMETERVRGNPPGITNTHVAANIRAARQAIGMDLRTMSDALGAAGRKLSPSGISKLENGDRRVDVDDLTVIAYLLRTSPAALLTPPDAQTTLTGVPESCLSEEIEKWARGELILTSDGLLAYWQQEWVQNLNRIQYFESALRHGSPSQASHDDYTKRLADLKERQRLIRERGVQIDPTGRVFDAADYAGRFGSAE